MAVSHKIKPHAFSVFQNTVWLRNGSVDSQDRQLLNKLFVKKTVFPENQYAWPKMELIIITYGSQIFNILLLKYWGVIFMLNN